MSKTKINYVCHQCGAQFLQWTGQCSDCGAWNSLTEEAISTRSNQNIRAKGYAGSDNNKIVPLAEVALQEQSRMSTEILEFDRVLGGGLVAGSVVLIGGDPGIGKSTLLLQTLCAITTRHDALYVTGEESLQQITLRARRLGLLEQRLLLLTETRIEAILTTIGLSGKHESERATEVYKTVPEDGGTSSQRQGKPKVIVIDSIQTIYTETISSAPGSVSQLRESTALLVQYAKQSGTTIFLVGHVTKEGNLAGPRVLEHMVDTVLYFEGEANQRFRMLRAIKNRFGAVNELGIFAMTDKGLREVNNPSAIFLSRYKDVIPGSSVLVTWEGSRPLLAEVQALVDESHLSNPRRVAVGLDHNRLSMLLAVLHRHGNIATYDQDVFINVVGGLKISETAADLALVLSVLSSLQDRALPEGLVVFGEIGLAGEIRPVQNGQERLREVLKHGFKRAIVPKGNVPKEKMESLEVIGVTKLAEVLRYV